MAIDRAFTIAGHGTVVTGSVSSGTAAVGEKLVIEPGGIEVRVRGIQNHDRKSETIQSGQRAAINVAGVRHDEVERGQELAVEGFLTPSQLLTVQLEVLPTSPRPVKNRSRVRIHLGTNETMANVVLLTAKEISPGTSAPAQLFLADAVVSSWNQAFVVRSESPVQTIGGGRVLVPAAEKMKRAGDAALECLDGLQQNDPMKRAAAAIYFAGTQRWTMADLARLSGVDSPEAMCEELVECGELVKLKVTAQRELIWHKQVLEEMMQKIEASLGKMHDREPLRSVVDGSRLRSQLSYCLDGPMLDHILRRMGKAKRIRVTDRGVGLAGRGPQLSKAETQLLSTLIQQFKAAGFQPPTVKECEAAATKNKASVASLVTLAATEGDLIEISSDYYLHREVVEDMRTRLTEQPPGDRRHDAQPNSRIVIYNAEICRSDLRISGQDRIYETRWRSEAARNQLVTYITGITAKSHHFEIGRIDYAAVDGLWLNMKANKVESPCRRTHLRTFPLLPSCSKASR